MWIRYFDKISLDMFTIYVDKICLQDMLIRYVDKISLDMLIRYVNKMYVLIGHVNKIC